MFVYLFVGDASLWASRAWWALRLSNGTLSRRRPSTEKIASHQTQGKVKRDTPGGTTPRFVDNEEEKRETQLKVVRRENFGAELFPGKISKKTFV